MEPLPVRRMAAAASSGVRWVLSHQRNDGSLTPAEHGIGGYYKVPYLLGVSGMLREANRLLDWIAANHLTPDGDFRAASSTALQEAHRRWPAYANSWIVLGAHRAGRWDLSRDGMRFILSRQSTNGSFPAIGPGGPYVEPVNTAWAALACLATGHMAEARGAAEVLAGLVDAQTDPHRFYYRREAERGLLTSYPPGDERLYVVDRSKPRQVWYNPGIALIFLCHMIRASGAERYEPACAWLVRLASGCPPDLLRFPPSGKLGLGCALHHAITGSERAREVALNVGAYLIDTQQADGSWRLPEVEPYASRPGREDFETRLDLTAEFSIFLLEMSALL